MGNPGQPSQKLRMNSWYLTLAGKPIVSVMGEMHYSCYPREQWEDTLLKMKANGINIVAAYVFWIHHEELEGQSFNIAITALKADYEMFFDLDPVQVKTGKAEVHQFNVVPEYRISFELE